MIITAEFGFKDIFYGQNYRYSVYKISFDFQLFLYPRFQIT